MTTFLIIWFGVGIVLSLLLYFSQKHDGDRIEWLFTVVFIPLGLAGLLACIYCGVWVLIKKHRGTIQ